MENSDVTCPVCDLTGQILLDRFTDGERSAYQCKRCGKYTITDLALVRTDAKSNIRLSAWIRSKNELNSICPDIDAKFVSRIEFPEYSVSEKYRLLLQAIARKSSFPGDPVQLNLDYDYPLVWGKNPDELRFFLEDFLFESGFLKRTDGTAFNKRTIEAAITRKGWEQVESYNLISMEKEQVFVAMSFSSCLRDTWSNAIRPAVEKTNYRPYRVDVDPHLERIDAKIISEIRNSAFVIADVTEHKQGVYFEAGFGMGLGIPVIWTVRTDDLQNAHFDTRQYNHLVWETPKELRQKLYDVICAVIGKRVVKPA